LKLFTINGEQHYRPQTSQYPRPPGDRERYLDEAFNEAPLPTPTDTELWTKLRLLRVELARFDKLLNVVDWQINPLEERVKCFTCKIRVRNASLVPCGHRPTCSECVQKHKKCQVCAADIENYVIDMVVSTTMTQEEEDLLLVRPPTDIEIRTSKIEQVFYLQDRADACSVRTDDLLHFFADFYHAINFKVGEYELESLMNLVRCDQAGRVAGDEFVKFVLTFTSMIPIEDFVKGTNDVLADYSSRK